MGIVLITIPYSGTNFAADLFVRRGFERCGLYDTPEKENFVHVVHVDAEGAIERAAALGHPIVTTFRHPFRIEEAHRRIGHESRAHKALRAWFSRLLAYDPFILAVDSDKREEQLQELEFGLGLSLETNWKPISSKAGIWDEDLSDFRPSETVKQLCMEQHQFLSTLYDL